jgi:hypothetical protein
VPVNPVCDSLHLKVCRSKVVYMTFFYSPGAANDEHNGVLREQLADGLGFGANDHTLEASKLRQESKKERKKLWKKGRKEGRELVTTQL